MNLDRISSVSVFLAALLAVAVSPAFSLDLAPMLDFGTFDEIKKFDDTKNLLLDRNVAFIVQEGNGNRATIDQVVDIYGGNGNYAEIGQSGGDINLGTIEQQGINNKARISQVGSENAASITQTGADNIASMTQRGLANVVDLYQLNDNNQFKSEQVGNNNLIQFTQNGNNIAELKEYGNSNKIIFDQPVGFRTVNVTLTGNNMTADIK